MMQSIISIVEWCLSAHRVIKKFCFFLQVYFWYPLNVVTGGTTAKIMLAAKDNFLGKYIYKDTLARNLAAVIYKVLPIVNNILSCLL